MATKPLKKLLVEGTEDQRVIPELIEASGIPWGETKETAIVKIKSYDGIENLLDKDVIYTELEDRGLISLGIIIDADDHPLDRWQSIRNVCLPTITDIPQELPDTGLVHSFTHNSKDLKFGVWMMPDNKIRGMLETFLEYLIPDTNNYLWDYSKEVVQEAKIKNAPFKDSYTDKAYIYTWLAWQKTPGRQLHDAIKQKFLVPTNPKAQIFVNWFKSLYDL
ncbi:DUF3226 domain-containing protein [Crocosphaera sp. XPORK-15E]|uniref:DUF3226 domain-containing protein n=1 Tax=Crocosphaera sp. XPORK-15E TaxID=3110247 RepID=UPI002B20F2A5|nr:DUF3226 domain-containing protein [Crocosphaera sp. XPORK-15E]MEA5532647.1 DUF3226 domain-containing protein [Crocosphaera sp. XPORK-15E]